MTNKLYHLSCIYPRTTTIYAEIYFFPERLLHPNENFIYLFDFNIWVNNLS